jgi:uncharacterized protein (DUF58 family)
MPNGPPAPIRTRKPITDSRKPASLLDADFVRKLDLLEIIFRRNVVGRREGDRPGVQRGGRIEFADYREYSPGDDLRYLDWNVYGRTDRLVVKEFTKQDAVLVCVLLDASASMAFGEPPKLFYAKRLAAALAYLALAGKNETQIGAFAGGEVRWSPRFAGRPDIQSLAAFLDPVEARGETDVLGALRSFSDRVGERSLMILLSDLMEDGEGRRGLRLLGSRRFDLAVIHVLSPQELHPPAVGAVRLADGESGLTEDLTVDQDALRLYADRLNAFCEGWRTFSERHDIRYTEASTATPFEECVLAYLRRGGLVR